MATTSDPEWAIPHSHGEHMETDKPVTHGETGEVSHRPGELAGWRGLQMQKHISVGRKRWSSSEGLSAFFTLVSWGAWSREYGEVP